MDQRTADIANGISKSLADRGLLIEGGWQAMKATVIHPQATPEQLDEMRMAFFAGAQHLFGSLMNILDPDAEPTDADMKRMDLIDAELRAFVKEVELRAATAKGNA